MTNTITQHLSKWAFGVFIAVAGLTQSASAQSVTIDPSGPIVCEGTTLNAVVTGLTGPFTYRWSTGATTPSITATQTGAIRVRVTGFLPNGNRRRVFSPWTAFFVVQTPSAIINPTGPVQVCPGDSALLQGSGGQYYSYYLWNNGDTTRNTTVNQTGTYELTVYNNFPGCYNFATASVDVEVFDRTFEPKITALSPITVCNRGFVQLAGEPGYSSYTWSTGQTTQNVSILMNGSQAGAVLDTLTVYLTVGINNNQCTFTSASTVLRSIRQTKLLSSYCGNYNLLATDSIKAEPVLTYITAPEYEFEFEETTNPGTTWTYTSPTRWCGLSAVTPAIVANSFYNVRVRPVIGGTPYCWGQTCQIGIIPTPGANNSDKSIASAGFASNVFPNPSSEAFRLVLRGIDANENVNVQVADLSGRVVDQFTYDTAAGSVDFGNNLNTGVYLVTARQGDLTSVTRIIKTN